MNDGNSRAASDPYRVEARILLKHLRERSGSRAGIAAARFLCLDRYAGEAADAVLADSDRIRLKDALVVIAREHGHRAWTDLKWAADAQAQVDVPMYESGFDVLLNAWFARYDDARAALERHGGYLLPYRHQFFVCETAGIRMLGLDPDDPDWDRIGHDWVRPANHAAWSRLRDKRRAAAAARGKS